RARYLTAWVDPFNIISEVNKNNNCIERVIADGASDLSIASRDIRVSPVGANVGESVHISATVRNGYGAASAVVEWWQGRPSNPEGVFLGSTPVRLSASGTGTAEFDWIRKDGVPEIHPRVVQAVPPDFNPTNDQNGRHLFLESIVDIGVDAEADELRFGRLTGRSAPEMVLGYSYRDPGPFGAFHSVVAVFQRAADGSYAMLWQREVLSSLEDIVLADLDNDGVPEVVAWSATLVGGTDPQVRINAFEGPSGAIKWEQNFAGSNTC